MSLYLKDPDARVSYAIDWSTHYLGDQLIAGSVWTVSPQEEGGLTVEENSHDGRRTSAVVAGGVIGRRYDVANRITLTNGDSDERSIAFMVEAR